MPDEISICSLELYSRIGVPDVERASPQRVLLDLTFEPLTYFSALGDDLAKTVDYAAVAERVKTHAATGERRLLETLGEEIAKIVLFEFGVARVVVELRKFVLPDAEYVAVRLERER